jgi:hypothetical protein
MLNPADYGFCSEFYIVEKSIEVVVSLGGEDRRIRIDALQAHGANIEYSTIAYIQENFTLQPTFPSTSSGFSRKPEAVTVWVNYALPWTNGTSADGVLQQALSFLGDRCRS